MLRGARWDANEVRDDLQHHVVEHLGDSRGESIIDETEFSKKGNRSVGVSHQYLSGVPTKKGPNKGLSVRCCLKNPEERAFYFTHAPNGMPLAKLVRVAGLHWAIGERFEMAKQETGFDESEVPSWID